MVGVKYENRLKGKWWGEICSHKLHKRVLMDCCGSTSQVMGHYWKIINLMGKWIRHHLVPHTYQYLKQQTGAVLQKNSDPQEGGVTLL